MKKILLATATLCAGLLFLAGCNNKSDKETTKSSSSTTATSSSEKKEEVDFSTLTFPQLEDGVADNEYLVEMVTTMGSIKIKLFPEVVPKTVENFVTHAKEGYYDGVIFHRVIDNFMVQSGDPEGTGAGGESIWGEPFEDESNYQLYNIRGALSMANAGPNTNGSQFFIVQNSDNVADGLLLEEYPQQVIDKYKEGGTPFLDYTYGAQPGSNHTVFGQVIEGMDVVDKIAGVETVAAYEGASEISKPKDDIKIEKINILQEPK